MNQFRIHNRRYRILMVFITLVALLFVRTIPLHTHNPHNHQDSSAQTSALDEQHFEIHASAFEADQEHQVAAKIDLSADVLAKNLGFNSLLDAALTFFAILFFFTPTISNPWSVHFGLPVTTRGIAFRPPLRAPPL